MVAEKEKVMIKINNQDKHFYQYMGKVFGSRKIQKEINDRIYDDNNKVWYLMIKDKEVTAFVAVNDDRIKNIYTEEKEDLVKLLKQVKREKRIEESIVPTIYKEIYVESGFQIYKNDGFKNFLTICM